MEEANSAYLTPKLNHNGRTGDTPRKKSPRHTLTNGFEKNEATFVSEGTAYAAHRFHNELGALQGHSKRRRTLAPPTHQPVTFVTTSAAVIMKPEPFQMALMEVNEEDEEMEAQSNCLKTMPNGTKLSREAFLEREIGTEEKGEASDPINDKCVCSPSGVYRRKLYIVL
ncbi:hypothetical protein ACTXT7_016246 [Hymenolepis weldensis]